MPPALKIAMDRAAMKTGPDPHDDEVERIAAELGPR